MMLTKKTTRKSQLCFECRKKHSILVCIGEELDLDNFTEANTTWVCHGCLKKAISLFSTKGKNHE